MKKIITLKSSDDVLFEVEEIVAMEFDTIKGFLEEKSKANDDDEPITLPLPNVSAAVLTRMITYFKQILTADPTSTEKVNAFHNEFAKAQSDDMLKELILAANYLEVKYFLDFLLDVAANRIKNKSVEYVRNFFGVANDYTPEEEAALRRENAWAFDGVDAD